MRWFSRLFARITERENTPTVSQAPLLLTNTLTGKKDIFTPIKAKRVGIYSCGPTVYGQAHIGNLRAYVFSDILARTLTQAGYRVKRVINITDVGHLQSDADEGEDKMEVGAQREGKTAKEIATHYTHLFWDDLDALNIDTEQIAFPRATDYIQEQIGIVKLLEQKGFTYKIYDGVYFDTAKFANYGALDHGGHKTREEAFAEIGRRISENKDKHHPADFALWKLSPMGSRRQQEWKSPWGFGFPGWHVECSAMSRVLLGQPFDIHTGGMDHIPVHHTNEIAQSEAAYGTQLARYWMHSAFLTVDTAKISKSLGNDVYLSEISERGYDPLSLRYLFLQAHYRSPLSFTWESLAASDEALKRLKRQAQQVSKDAKGIRTGSDESRKMVALLRDDLSTPAALAYLWEILKDDYLAPSVVLGVIEAADAVLGLELFAKPTTSPVSLDDDIRDLVRQRDMARAARDFARADELRIHMEERGYRVEDGPSGTVVTRKPG